MSSIALPNPDNTANDPAVRPPLVGGGQDFASITDVVAGVVERPRPPWGWYAAMVISSAWTGIFFLLVGYLVSTGIGVWGNNIPVAWAFDIVNFVFWIGIGHAGTLISAILFLFRQKWRTSINRAAEAMTIFAVICAGLFPALHVGRVWVEYWLFPYPNQMSLWPNFRSPLLWDVFAVGTYATVSLLFWYLGMIPDLATLRDRATSRLRKILYGLFALGWRGSARQWHRYERAYLLLAALSTPLVVSVHSVVSCDFAVAQLPGWHTTLFPPYFVAGAIFSGFAMVVTLMVPARAFFGLKDLITIRHLENMNKFILATGCMVGYAYVVEFFSAWYSANRYEWFAAVNRALGPYAWCYWTMVLCNVVAPQLFWLKKWRTSPWRMVIVAVLVNVGMWMERFAIIVVSLSRDYLPSSWGFYSPTWVDLCMLAGSFGLFFTLFLLFCRYLPMVAMAEVKAVLPQAHGPVSPTWTGLSETGSESRRDSTTCTGLLAELPGPEALRTAAEKIRDAGYRRWDAHSPFPVHGIERAMGIRPTILPWLVLGGGIAGGIAALVLQWWTNAIDYPYLISGKPLFSLPANIPVTFELIVLFSAFAAFGGVVALNLLPQYWHPAFSVKRFARVTSDGFFISIEAGDPKFDPVSTKAFLESLGATAVEVCYAPTSGWRVPSAVKWTLVIAAALALLPPLWIARVREVPSGRPRLHLVQDMDFQPRYQAQGEGSFFADGRAARPPMPGTVPVGGLETDAHYWRGQIDGKWATTLPVRADMERMQRGRERFQIYCAACHGLAAEGDGMTHLRAVKRREPGWVQPRSLHVANVRQQPVGQLFHTITHGLNTMPGYAAQIPVDDRWAIVLYVRALQRSQNATLQDVPAELLPALTRGRVSPRLDSGLGETGPREYPPPSQEPTKP